VKVPYIPDEAGPLFFHLFAHFYPRNINLEEEKQKGRGLFLAFRRVSSHGTIIAFH
jgi:hypothetical protein